ncbi:MAG: glycosyltransferase [Candidatus Nanopelagicales bacterium]
MNVPPRVVAVIPVLDPPVGVEAHVREVGAQVDDVVVVDDGSVMPVTYGGVRCIQLDRNRGIAAALNAGVEEAVRLGATHVLTVDQDSQLPPGYVKELLECGDRAVALGLRPAAVGAGEFGQMSHRGTWRSGVMVVPEAIQSGTLFARDALEAVGGFDEALVIDGVDTDVSLRLADAGWDVCVAPVSFDHQLGSGHFVSVLGRQVWASQHPAYRRYYITRNGLALLRRHGRKHVRWALVYARRLGMASLLAAGERTQRSAMRRGVRDALRGRWGRLSEGLRSAWSA